MRRRVPPVSSTPSSASMHITIFGTDDLYLPHCTRLLRSGGRLGIVVPGVVHELTEIPDYLRPFWMWDFCSFHSADWWRSHWQKSTLIEVELADSLRGGWRLWLEWEELRAREGSPTKGPLPRTSADEVAMLRADGGRTLSFTRVVGRKP